MYLQNNLEFRLFLEHTPGAVAMFDREMRYLAASRKWLTDYDLKQESLIGRCHYEIFPKTAEKWKAIHQRCLAGSTESGEADSFVQVNGSLEWVKWESRPW
jgi:PAS domain S-box-containing protein